MTERPVTETGIFSRSGFSNPSKSAELIKTLKSEINHELLIDDLSKVADPDNALLLLVRIADQQDKNLDKVLELRSEYGLTFMAGPIEITEGPAAGQRIIYVLDPWNNQLELVEYERKAK